MKLGLFLTPGAARTAYQVGAAQALVRAGLEFDVVAASSAGTLNGAFVATGQVDTLAELWSKWATADLIGVDWPELARGAVAFARDLMQNHRQRRDVIDPHLGGATIRPGTRLRCNLTDLTVGEQAFVEWPGAAMPLAEGVDTSVAVPVAIRPHERAGHQWADGLGIDGFPIEELLLSTGVDVAFVIGVAPRRPSDLRPANAYRLLLRAAEWNQYSETTLGLADVANVNARIRTWATQRAAAAEAITALAVDDDERRRLLDELDALYREAAFPEVRRDVRVVAILPEAEIEMFFTDWQPARSRRLLAQGYRDAENVLASLNLDDVVR